LSGGALYEHCLGKKEPSLGEIAEYDANLGSRSRRQFAGTGETLGMFVECSKGAALGEPFDPNARKARPFSAVGR
jgi:hypothetical protein